MLRRTVPMAITRVNGAAVLMRAKVYSDYIIPAWNGKHTHFFGRYIAMNSTVNAACMHN